MQSFIHACVVCPWRFHNPAKEPALNYDVVLPVDDDVQLSVVQYRNKLYEVQNGSKLNCFVSDTRMKPNLFVISLQMMVERRTNEGMLRLIQPKEGDCNSSRDKPSAREKVEKGPLAANSSEDGNKEAKTQHEKTDATNQVPSHTVVTKPGLVNVSALPAVEKTSPLTSPSLGKVTYNPITHAPSTCDFICAGSTQGWISDFFV